MSIGNRDLSVGKFGRLESPTLRIVIAARVIHGSEIKQVVETPP
jgi:hypothetical protein